MVPEKPARLFDGRTNIFRETIADMSGRVAGDNGVGVNIFSHHRAAADNRPVADVNSGHDGCVMADPDIMAYANLLPAPPVEEGCIIGLGKSVSPSPVHEMVLLTHSMGWFPGLIRTSEATLTNRPIRE